MIEAGKTVGFEYTLKLDDGSVVQSNKGGEPLKYVHGENQILPALEQQLEGLDVDDEKNVKLSAEDAYGEIKEEAFQEVPTEQIPEDARRVGAQLSAQGYNGAIRVHEVKDETVVLDFNHPLAGQDLMFDIRVVSIE
ncbi:MAG: peptidylprolyl isomerase [Gammaproteobacteria bacterium]|nr:peptidylprolyl isomerase [Gammaproteobacteria bacterium]